MYTDKNNDLQSNYKNSSTETKVNKRIHIDSGKAIVSRSIESDKISKNTSLTKLNLSKTDIHKSVSSKTVEDKFCGICYIQYEPNEKIRDSRLDLNELKKVMCGHVFCKSCWKMYLNFNEKLIKFCGA